MTAMFLPRGKLGGLGAAPWRGPGVQAVADPGGCRGLLCGVRSVKAGGGVGALSASVLTAPLPAATSGSPPPGALRQRPAAGPAQRTGDAPWEQCPQGPSGAGVGTSRAPVTLWRPAGCTPAPVLHAFTWDCSTAARGDASRLPSHPSPTPFIYRSGMWAAEQPARQK